MKPQNYLISKVSIDVIKRELKHLDQYIIHTPDSTGSVRKILDTLKEVEL